MTTTPLREGSSEAPPQAAGGSRFAASTARIPASAGVGFKHAHLDAILSDPGPVGFLEVHAENYMGDGGFPHRALERVRRDFPLSLHGVCMSIGGPRPLSADHLDRFRALVERYEPALVSEHLAWSTHDEVFMNDLLPLPYTEETLGHVCAHVERMQDHIGRRILLENPSTYVVFDNSTMSETDFLREIVRRTGCGLLLDVNNVFVSATNHGFSPMSYLVDYPMEHVGEIHLAGHAVQEDDEGDPLLIDSHDAPVADAVWDLFSVVVRQCGPVPTLVEWDSDLPDWPVLRAEAEAADRILDEAARTFMMGKSHATGS
ncbi:MNIO family bufferin maturase [Oricola thermophila]|uniref:UPF0276 protein HTY61_18865 n=1 Tax=Oricola thermophila TaxID=2742145 RepID=A0A6N1VIV7_9HYPH|nr:DUF692 domain-containing protein [Oricola thermophila]QKV20363.1 DUF692 domain-containing protein [Oricola thermophila]